MLLSVVIGPLHAGTNAPMRAERLHKEFYSNGNVKYEAMVDDHGGSRIIRWFNKDGNPKEGVEREGLFERTYRGGVVVAINEYYPSGKLKSEGLVTNNAVLVQREYDDTGKPKSGIHRETFPNGNYVDSTYQNGKKDGIERRYERGSLLIQSVWVDGTLEYEKVLNKDGLVTRTVWYRNGTQETRKDFLDDGSLDQIRTTEGGVEEFRRYSGGKLSIEYRGRQYTSYQTDGAVLELGAYDESQRRDGLLRLFGDNGHIRREMMWSHGKLDGTNRTFYNSGRLKCEAVCSQDRFVRGTFYGEDGEATKGINEEEFVAEFGLQNWARNGDDK